MAADTPLTAAEQMAYLEKAMKHLVENTKDKIGLELEMFDWGLESEGRLDFDTIEPESLVEFRQLLFSCEVVEGSLRFKAPAREYPRIVGQLELRLRNAI